MVEPLSNRAANAPNHAYFAANQHTANNEQQPSAVASGSNGGQAILRDLPITNNLQKSSDVHCRVDRQNSFVLYGNRKGPIGHKLHAQQEAKISGLN